jgi:hypothetical protein
MKHPHNKEFGKGSIIESCGWVCVAQYEDGSNAGEGIYSDHEHSMCELFNPKPSQNLQN